MDAKLELEVNVEGSAGMMDSGEVWNTKGVDW